MADRQIRLGVLRGAAEQLPVKRDRTLVLTESHARGRVERLERDAFGLIAQQLIQLLPCLLVAVQLHQHERVFLARDAVVRRPLEQGGEQHLGVEIDLVRDADAGQEPHRLDVIAVLEEKGAHECLGRLQVAVQEQPGRQHHFLRQAAQGGDVTARRGGILLVALHAVKALEHLPAAWQRVVEVHRLEKGLSGLRRLPQLDEAAAAFLVQATEARMVLLERRECPQGGRDLSEVALRDGLAKERLTLGRGRLQHGRDRGEHFGKTALPEQFAQWRCTAGRGGWGCAGGRGIHGLPKKGADRVVRPSY